MSVGMLRTLAAVATAAALGAPNVSQAQSHMFIVMPLTMEKSAFSDLFRTHPNTERRITKLVELMGHPNPYAA